jgi:soluble lytic murein transglycosylase
MGCNRRCIASLVLLLGLVSVTTPAVANEAIADYRALRASLDTGDIGTAEARLDDLRGTLLEGHATMAVLRSRLESVDAARVERFLERHNDLTGSDGFKVAWLRELADREAWQRLDATYTGQRDVHVRCAVVEAREALGRTEQAVGLALQLWHVGYRQPGRCNKAFDLLEREGELTSKRLRERMRLAVAAGNTDLARAYLDRLPTDQRGTVEHWLRIYQDPAHAADVNAAELGRKRERASIISSAVRALAYRDPIAAHNVWQRIQNQHSVAEVAPAIERAIALHAVYDGLPEGSEWLLAIPDTYANATVHAWRVRDALRRADWPTVLEAIERMPAEQAAEPRWRYWHARALASTGQDQRADEHFKAIAADFSYYGFLAADAVERNYAPGDELPAPDKDRQARVSERAQPRRGLWLHRAGHEAAAIPVWRAAVNELANPDDRLAAARLAAEADWPWAAMFASGRAGHQGASPLRFPRGHAEVVAAASEAHGIPATWIYALIRQESAFQNTACSSAGACGLTQLMPATGRWMLKRLGHPDGDLRESLARPERNIPAGTAYLAYLRERFDHPAAALAAYNAGPSNVRRWQASEIPVGTPRWLETLTFGETRDYTMAVLFNRTVYDLLAQDATSRLASLLDGGTD